MDKLYDLMKESFLTRFVIVLVITILVATLYYQNGDVPKELLVAWGAMWGFYFNASQAIGQALKVREASS